MPDNAGFTTIYVPAEVRKQLRIRAAHEGKPMYKILEEWLAAHPLPSTEALAEKEATDVND